MKRGVLAEASLPSRLVFPREKTDPDEDEEASPEKRMRGKTRSKTAELPGAAASDRRLRWIPG